MAEEDGGKAFEAAIAEIDRQMEDLRRARDTLLRLMGKSSQEPAGAPRSPSGSTVIGDPIAAVREQEFSGMSAAKAARAFLQKIGRHEKTPVIIAALKKGGVEVRGKNPVSTMYTTLSRRPAFVALGKNYWDLAERRPDLAGAKKSRSSTATHARRKGRRRKGTKTLTRVTPEVAESA